MRIQGVQGVPGVSGDLGDLGLGRGSSVSQMSRFPCLSDVGAYEGSGFLA